MENIELSLFNIQRTYLQSPQPKLNQEIFQTIVKGQNFDKMTLQKLAPTLPIYVKMMMKWSPRVNNNIQRKRTFPQKINQIKRESKTIPVRLNESHMIVNKYNQNIQISENTSRMNDLIQQQKLQLGKKSNLLSFRMRMRSQAEPNKKYNIMIPKMQPKQQIDQITLTPW